MDGRLLGFALVAVTVVLADIYVGPTTREFHLDFTRSVSDTQDCYSKSIILVNGMLPGPAIEAYNGDMVNITVYNNLLENLTVHWHGINQLNSTWADGPNMVSQCPIPPGGTHNYVFTITDQTGTYFYHSHFGAQRTEGAEGPFLVLNKTAETYYDDRTIVIQDWWHLQAETIRDGLVNGSIGFQYMADGILINGKGPSMGQFPPMQNINFHSPTSPFDCRTLPTKCDNCPIEVIEIEGGPSYRLRLLNLGAFYNLNIHIENHTMTLIEADGWPTKPIQLDSITITPAQRYSVIINADQPSGDYWIVVEQDGNPAQNQTAILRYSDVDPQNRTRPTTANPSWTFRANGAAIQNPDSQPTTATREIIMNLVENLGDPATFIPGNITINAKKWREPFTPVVEAAYFKRPDLLPPSHYVLNKGDVVNVTLQLIQPVCNDHPFHLHGHDFWVVAKGNGTYPNHQWYSPENPILRDTELLLADDFNLVNETGCGWLQLRFVADNPGVWFFHCHIEWHLIMGMGTVWVERSDEILPPPKGFPLCGGLDSDSVPSIGSLVVWNPIAFVFFSMICSIFIVRS